MIEYKREDINQELARRSFMGTSFRPEQRAELIIDDYMRYMADMIERFGRFETDDNREVIEAGLERHREHYIKLLQAYLSSHSNVVSTMIAGPSGFPVARMNKRSQWADNHRDRWLSWVDKDQERLLKKHDPRRASKVIRLDDADAADKLRQKIDDAERLQAMMKEGNKIIRSKGTDEEKRGDLQALGFSDRLIHEAMTPDYANKLGFPAYMLSNNNANIRRLKDRLVQVEREADRTADDDWDICPGVTVSENAAIVRLQIFFEGKPPNAVRGYLKANGFRWAPSEGAWQRLLNDNARMAIQRIKSHVAQLMED